MMMIIAVNAYKACVIGLAVQFALGLYSYPLCRTGKQTPLGSHVDHLRLLKQETKWELGVKVLFSSKIIYFPDIFFMHIKQFQGFSYRVLNADRFHQESSLEMGIWSCFSSDTLIISWYTCMYSMVASSAPSSG